MNDPETTYFWLLRPDAPLYPHALGLLTGQMHTARLGKRFNIPAMRLDEIKFIADETAAKLERAYARLECAWAAWRLKQPARSEGEINEALPLLAECNPHDLSVRRALATAYWMRASISSATAGRFKEAVADWQRSLTLLQTLACEGLLTAHEREWYEIRCDHMRAAIQSGISPPPAPPRAGAWASIYPPGNIHTPVLGFIPAGGWKTSPDELDPLEIIALQDGMEQFTIEQLPHRLFELRGQGRSIHLPGGEVYFILRVDGDSMNRRNIEPGDYVLMRQANSAQHGDIVAAEIIGVDNHATLKLYTEQIDAAGKRAGTLSPDSTNPSHQPLSDKRFAIRGVAIGVFKENK
jgi:hypothetical protein